MEDGGTIQKYISTSEMSTFYKKINLNHINIKFGNYLNLNRISSM
jgi:hypothetical protein